VGYHDLATGEPEGVVRAHFRDLYESYRQDVLREAQTPPSYRRSPRLPVEGSGALPEGVAAQLSPGGAVVAARVVKRPAPVGHTLDILRQAGAIVVPITEGDANG
jgi:hypothetical protein